MSEVEIDVAHLKLEMDIASFDRVVSQEISNQERYVAD
jgi:hypothetical protein